jgi:hypothetical protein
MEIDFYQDYKDLPVPELVKVARSPWDYLPEAVTAAQQILRERGISAEEIAAEEWKLAQKEMSDALTEKRFSDYFDWVRELFPSAEEGPRSRPWIYLFLLSYALYYVYNIYLVVATLAYFARCEACSHTGFAIFALVVESVYLTATLFFLLKQKPLGWALLFIQAVVLNCIKFSMFYKLYARHAYLPSLLTFYVLPFLVYVAVVIFLWRPFVLEFFRVRPKFRDIAALVAIGLGIVGMMRV